MDKGQELYEVDNSKFIEAYRALENLEKNKDFQTLIIDGYLGDKALDSVSLLARPDVKKRGERADVMEDLVAISNLRYYLFMVKRLGESALDDLQEADEEERR